MISVASRRTGSEIRVLVQADAGVQFVQSAAQVAAGQLDALGCACVEAESPGVSGQGARALAAP
jgi:hypothetical protein